jgi:hypothetical protein
VTQCGQAVRGYPLGITEPRDTGQEGMAEALHTLTDETQLLARR